MAQTLIHLDTSFLIRAFIRGTAEDQNLREWLSSGVTLRMSAVAWAEFACGPVGSGELSFAGTIVGKPEAFAGDDALRAAELFNRTGRRRGSLIDCMIAASAIAANASLATSNRRDFEKFPDLQVV